MFYRLQKLQYACFPFSPGLLRFRIRFLRSRHLRLQHNRNTQTLQPQEIIHTIFVSAMQFQDRDLPATPPHRVRKNPHTSGTARQTRTSLKPYCCSTHLNVFKFKIVSVQRFSMLTLLFQSLTLNTFSIPKLRDQIDTLVNWKIIYTSFLHFLILQSIASYKY